MQSTGDIAAFRIGRCVPNKLKEREVLPSNLRLQEPSYLGNEQQMYGASIINGCLLGLPEFLHEKSGSLVLYQQTAIKDLESLF